MSEMRGRSTRHHTFHTRGKPRVQFRILTLLSIFTFTPLHDRWRTPTAILTHTHTASTLQPRSFGVTFTLSSPNVRDPSIQSPG